MVLIILLAFKITDDAVGCVGFWRRSIRKRASSILTLRKQQRNEITQETAATNVCVSDREREIVTVNEHVY